MPIDVKKAFSAHILHLSLILLVSTVSIASDTYSAENSEHKTGFPETDLFTPLIAAPKQPEFYITYANVDPDNEGITLGSVGFGHTFGLYRWLGENPGNGWQLNFFGAVFSQFNMDTSSDDLINTDFLVGFPLTYRHNSFSARFRLFHQSSHLGDELLLGPQPPERINLSVEIFDVIASYEWEKWRTYAGIGKALRVDPDDLKRWGAQAGVEYRTPIRFLGAHQFLGGFDVQSFEEVDWDASFSLKFGLRYGKQLQGGNGIRLMVEGYDGPIPFGQFYSLQSNYVGIGVYFEL